MAAQVLRPHDRVQLQCADGLWYLQLYGRKQHVAGHRHLRYVLLVRSERVVDKHSTYLRMSNYAGWYVDDNNQPVTAYTNITGMGEAVLWHAVSSAPSAWVAMRD